MAKNKLIDLNDHLYVALERLNDEEISTEKVDSEIKRAKAIMGVSKQIVDIAKVTLNAMKLISNGDIDEKKLPDTFETKRNAIGAAQNGS